MRNKIMKLIWIILPITCSVVANPDFESAKQTVKDAFKTQKQELRESKEALKDVIKGERVLLYGKVNTVAGYPMAGVGVRTKKNHNGLDFSAGLMPRTNLKPMVAAAKASYLFYPKRYGFYLNGGTGVITEPNIPAGYSLFFNGGFGYQWEFDNGSSLFLESTLVGPVRQPAGTSPGVWPEFALGMGF